MREHHSSILRILDQGSPQMLPAGIMYGRTELQFVTDTKPMRKSQAKMERCKNARILDDKVEVSTHGLSHVKNGDVFPHVKLGEQSFFIRPDIVHETGEEIKDLAVITGSCLFGEFNARGYTNHGRELSLVNKNHTRSLSEGEMIIDITAPDFIYPYEVDTMLRIANATQLLPNRGADASMYLHIPNAEYWMYLFDTFHEGRISAEALMSWCQLVDDHSNSLARGFAKRITRQTGQNVQIYEPFQDVDLLIMSHLQDGNIPSLEQVIEVLADSDPLWESQMRQAVPESFGELSTMANTIAYRHCLLRHEGVLALENPEEYKILKETATYPEARMGNFFGGLYIHPHVFIADAQNLHGDIYDLYYAKDYNGLAVTREIISANR